MPPRILTDFERRVRRATATARRALGGGDAPRDYESWLKQVSPRRTWDWPHQRIVYPYLNRIAAGERVLLCVFMPPQHGKSSLITERFAAYLLERRPELRILLAAYNQTRANRYSLANRRIAERRIELVRDQKEKRLWETTAGGYVYAVGVGSGVTGYSGDVLVLDDPVRSRAEAESATYRERMWDWWQNDARTRLQESGSAVVIMTRWHTDDLAGRLLSADYGGGEPWEVVSLPALAERDDPLGRAEGEALCPARYSLSSLLETRRAVDAYTWASLYQQRPTPREGGLFDLAALRFVERPPDGLRWVRYYDLAIGSGRRHSFNATLAAALGPDGTIYFRDGLRMRGEYPDIRGVMEALMRDEPTTLHGIEAKLHGVPAVQELLREPGLAGTAFLPVPVHGDKYTRALSWATRLKLAHVAFVTANGFGARVMRALESIGGRLRADADWMPAIKNEMATFPNGATNDLVDAASGCVQMLSGDAGGDVEEGPPLAW